MTYTVYAVYENGVLKPEGNLPLREGDRVEVVVRLAERVDTTSPADPERRKIIEELHQIDAEIDAEPDDGYDLVRAINENRKREGSCPVPSEPDNQP